MANKHRITAIVRNKRGRILGVGQNSYTVTHPLMAKASKAVQSPHRIYLHAEVAALLKVKDWSQAFSMEVFRYTKDNQPALSKPCACCQWILAQTGIKKIYHT